MMTVFIAIDYAHKTNIRDIEMLVLRWNPPFLILKMSIFIFIISNVLWPQLFSAVITGLLIAYLRKLASPIRHKADQYTIYEIKTYAMILANDF